MLTEYIKTSLLRLDNEKKFYPVGLVRPAIAIVMCIAVILYLRLEFSYDTLNRKEDRIFRVVIEGNRDGKLAQTALTPATLGPYLEHRIPQIERVARLYAPAVLTSMGRPTLKYGKKVLRAGGFMFVDSTFLDMFSLEMISGDPENSLEPPFSVVLTKSAAGKLFGGEDPLGKTLFYDNGLRFTVRGVAEDPSVYSTIGFDFLGSMNSLPDVTADSGVMKNWDRFNFYTFVLLRTNANLKETVELIRDSLSEFWDPGVREMAGSPRIGLEPFRDHH